MNGTANRALTNDENWKLLNFIYKQIEENKAETKRVPKKRATTPKPIRITGDLLAKRKRKKKNGKFVRNTILSLGTTSSVPVPKNKKHHSKTKSALYTSASNNIYKRTRNSALYTPIRTSILPKIKLHEHIKSKTEIPSSPIHHEHLLKDKRKSKSNDVTLPKHQKIEAPISPLILLDDAKEDIDEIIKSIPVSTSSEINNLKKEDSNLERIRFVYAKYCDFYQRVPLYPDHLMSFGNKINVRLSFAKAKEFLDNLRGPQPPPPPMSKLKYGYSVSSPNLMNSDKKKSKTQNSASTDSGQMYTILTETELLQCIKDKINEALKLESINCIKSSIESVWNNEYNELETRLHRASYTKSNVPQLQLQRDTTYMNLKHLSNATDVDDTDHDAAVYLLSTYFPDDEVAEDTNNKSDDLSLRIHRSSKLKVRNSHFRSVTADRKVTSIKKTSSRKEALLLYDSMVMKARKIKQNPLMLKPIKSAPTLFEKHKHGMFEQMNMNKTMLQAIPSQHSQETIVCSIDNTSNEIVIDLRMDASSINISEEEENETDERSMNEPFEMLDAESFDDEKSAEIIPRNLQSVMSKYIDHLDDWGFDIFSFMDDPSLANNGLVYAAFSLFNKTNLLNATGVEQSALWHFLECVQSGYLNNPYHNVYHALDVLLSTHFMFQSQFFKHHFTIWDQFAAYLAALCHDLGHMGLNNTWYINTAGNLALLYGNDSVLEHHHIAETFRILNNDKNNFLALFPSSVRRYVSTVIKRSILATDLKNHGANVYKLQNMVNVYKNENRHNNLRLWRCESIANYASLINVHNDHFKLFLDESRNEEWILSGDVIVRDLDIENGDDANKNNADDMKLDDTPKRPRILGIDDERIFLLECTMHACDVANPCKPIEIAKEWAKRYLEEAFDQGDKERHLGVPVSAGMDRFTSKLPASQIGFITFVVKRLFELYSEINDASRHCLDVMLKNEQYWIKEKEKAKNKK